MLLKRSLPKIRWKYWVKPWQQVDWLLFCLPVGVSIFGGIMILSTELKQPVTDWWWHWLVAGIGVLIALFLARCRYENLDAVALGNICTNKPQPDYRDDSWY